MRAACLSLIALGALAPSASAARPLTPAEAAFERHVRPVLIEHCVKCHGPKKSMGGLRLDTRAGLLAGADNGPVVKLGSPETSPLIQAVRHTGERKMPPKSKLSPQAVADLTAWVKAGAPWPERAADRPGEQAWRRHWAFQPVRHPAAPTVKNAAAAPTAIDRFLLSRLEAKGLTFSPPADRRTLVRRATFDLIGLPPTPEEVADFVNDERPDAYERLIDRLLASPHYGEKWGRHWLDVARYADTKGYVFFEEANFTWAWTYRDYVIESFNADLPYDRFLVEQLAADRLPLGKDKRPLRALGFVTLGARFMNNPHDVLDDRIDVVTRGLMGLTVSCARCHDHKFDPIPTADYYSLYGVFASSVEPTVPPLYAPLPETAASRAFVQELARRERALSEFRHGKFLEVTEGARSRVAEYLLAAHARHGQPSAEEFMLVADGNDLNPAMLVRWQAYLERTSRRPHRVFAPWHQFAALPEKDFTARAETIVKGLSPERVNGLLVEALRARPPRNLSDVAARYADVLLATERRWREARALAYRLRAPLPVALPDSDREELRQVFHGPDAPPNVARSLFNDLALLPDRPSQGRLQQLRRAVEQWRATGPGAPPRAMALEDAPRPYEPRIFRRGNPNNAGEAVPRRFLEVLSGPKRAPFREDSGRLELARAIADRQNPLTARVLVNRLWTNHFGQGLVGTPSDFGLRADAPTHPELLDHLAATFVDGGWSIKKMHRLILLSTAYRQQSIDRPEARRLSPDNALLWRTNRRRLDFEGMRDALLAVSGQLNRSVGGPSMTDTMSPGSRRRTLYGFVDRLQVPGLYRTFDFPSPDATSAQRDTTTVPQQALFMMNSPFVVGCARALLSRADVAKEKDVAVRVGRLYRLCYARGPSAEEVALARAFVGAGGAAEWLQYAQALLVANEFVFVD